MCNGFGVSTTNFCRTTQYGPGYTWPDPMLGVVGKTTSQWVKIPASQVWYAHNDSLLYDLAYSTARNVACSLWLKIFIDSYGLDCIPLERYVHPSDFSNPGWVWLARLDNPPFQSLHNPSGLIFTLPFLFVGWGKKEPLYAHAPNFVYSLQRQVQL